MTQLILILMLVFGYSLEESKEKINDSEIIKESQVTPENVNTLGWVD